TLTGANSFVDGIDNSDSDKWKLSYGSTGNAAFGSNDFLSCTVGGLWVFTAAAGGSDNVTIRCTDNHGKLNLHRNQDIGDGSGMANIRFTADLTGTATEFVNIQVQNTTTSNAQMLFQLRKGGTTTETFQLAAAETVANDTGADIDFRIEGDSLAYLFFTDDTSTTENIVLFASSQPNYQSMDQGIYFGNVSTAPTGNPTG